MRSDDSGRWSMALVGNEADAARAARGGMEKIAEGGQRNVYHDAAGDVVYKVENEQGRKDRTNSHEHANADLFAGCPGIPPTALYAVGAELVLAMPYYAHSMKDWSGTEEVCRALASHFGDLQLNNMRRDASGAVWFIDLATRGTSQCE
jgi:hypothetical protein